MLMKKLAFYAIVIGAVYLVPKIFSGGGSKPSGEIVDLDLVLDSFISTADSIAPEEQATETESDASILNFIESYTQQLNTAPLMADKTIGVYYGDEGSFLGFDDSNANGSKDSNEENIFSVEVDEPRSRLIATDLLNSYHRDYGYRPGTGFLAGALVSRMLFSQNRAGISPNRHANTQVQKKGYHKLVSKARSARSSSGSKSFRVGK